MLPRVIHYCWFGGNPKNEMIEKCIASWRKYCPDYQIIEWNENNYDVNAHPFMKKAYEAKKWAFVSDYARIDILFRHGGIYLDTDVELIRGLDDFLDCDFFAGFESPAIVAFGLGFGAAAGHPVLRDIMDTYDELEFPDDTLELPKISCPIIQTNALKKRGLQLNGRSQTVEGCHIYSAEYFCPMSCETGKIDITDKTVSIHHYDMSWLAEPYRRAKQQKWRLMQRFGEKRGSVIASVISFPAKISARIRDGSFKNYIRFMLRSGKKDG